jgi:hypothetical protein
MQSLSQRSAEVALAVLVALAILLRLQPILSEPSAVWADEIFQTSEPAHRLVYGSGLVAWEFQLGVRSWLLPGLIAGLMELSRIIGDGPDFYLPVIAVVLPHWPPPRWYAASCGAARCSGLEARFSPGSLSQLPPSRFTSVPVHSPKRLPATW